MVILFAFLFKKVIRLKDYKRRECEQNTFQNFCWLLHINPLAHSLVKNELAMIISRNDTLQHIAQNSLTFFLETAVEI